MKGLTKRQSEIMDFIHEFIKSRKFSPSYRDIMEHFQFSSLGTVYRHLKVLKRKGALEGEKNGGRSLAPVLPLKALDTRGELMLPFIGQIAVGEPIEMFAQSQTLAVPDFLVQSPDRTYALRARGDSLQGELIADGDIILVEAREKAFVGETIIGFVNEHATIIKRYYREGNYVRLESPGEHHGTLLSAEELSIQGILVGLIRSFSH